ncbi:MAG: hypothetical protein ACLFT5_08070 [Desulfovermiculus sp.]
MTLDLTGITNENEFYTHHYLLAILENDLKDLFKEWNRRQKEEKIPTPASLISGLAREYFRLRSELSETKDEDTRRQLQENSHKHAYTVSEDLKYALRECIELLGNEAVWYLENTRRKGIYSGEKKIDRIIGISKGQTQGLPLRRTVTDDTLPTGPYEKTIEYVPPFDKCDREEDYETVWAEFEQRLR